MATFYKYAEKEADSYINWADIGKNMSDMLLNENKIREEKKAALDEESRKYGQVLSNPPQGDSKQLNQYSLEFAAQLQDARLMQDKLLKSGQLKLKDYLVMRQNTTDGTSDTFNVMKEYQAEFKEKMERAQSQDPSKASQDLETFVMGSVEGFANFNKSQLYINPTDGKISVALKEKKMVNGKEIYVMSSNPNDFATVASLRNRIKGKYDLYDVPKNIGAMVDSLGVEINSLVETASTLGAGGTIRETLDITKRTNLPKDLQGVVMKFEQAETQLLDAQLQNHFNVTSILTNTLKTAENGKPYGYTYNPKERDANPNMILLKEGQNGPEPDFEGPVGQKQYDAARERLRLQARMEYDKKSELKTTAQNQLQQSRPPTQIDIDQKDRLATARNVAQNIVYSLTGNANESAAGTKYLSASTGLPFQKTKEGYNITDENGNVQSFKFKADGKTLADPTKFTKSFIGTISRKMGINEDDVIKQFGKLLPKGATINVETEAQGFEQKAPAADPFASYGNAMSTIVPTISSDEDEAFDTLNPALAKLGASVRIPFTRGNYIVVKAPNGKESPEIKLDDATQAKQAVADWLKANPKGATDEQRKAWIKSLQSTGIIAPEKTAGAPRPT